MFAVDGLEATAFRLAGMGSIDWMGIRGLVEDCLEQPSGRVVFVVRSFVGSTAEDLFAGRRDLEIVLLTLALRQSQSSYFEKCIS